MMDETEEYSEVLGSDTASESWEICSQASSLASSWAPLDLPETVLASAASMTPEEEAETAAALHGEMTLAASAPTFAQVLLRQKLQHSAGVARPAAQAARRSSLPLLTGAAAALAKEDDDANDEDGPCSMWEKDGRGGQWTRAQCGPRSTKQRSHVEQAIKRRAMQRQRGG